MWLFRAQMTTLSDNNLTFFENFFLHKIERKKQAKFVPVQLTENENKQNDGLRSKMAFVPIH